MSFYDENKKVLYEEHPDIYQGIMKYQADTERVLVGEALNGEKFLAIEENGDVVSLGSIYNPSHAAERFASQFVMSPKATIVLLLGLGDGGYARYILQESSPVEGCIIYEPSCEIFYKAICEIDMRDILSKKNLRLIIGGVNDTYAEQIIEGFVPAFDSDKLLIAAAPKYAELFPGEVEKIQGWYRDYVIWAKGNMTASIKHAKRELENEIKAQRWLMDSYLAYRMKKNITENMTCIIVSAGPSLEKNIEQLRAAKGKSCIIAVDSAINYMLQKEIVPDYICTIDPRKYVQLLKDTRLENMPVFVSTESDYHFLEQFNRFVPIYFHTHNLYYEDILRERDCDIIKSNGGGSVSTMSFFLALELGFHTIVLVGQDLAFTNMNSHAGTGKAEGVELTGYTLFEVEGYYGDTVLTRADFKIYLEWFNQTIAQLSEQYTVINATEGGARILGTIPMSLEAAIQSFCTSSLDCEALYKNTEKIWGSFEEKQKFYHELKRGLHMLSKLETQAKEAISLAERVLTLLNRGSYVEKELRTLEGRIDFLLTQIRNSQLYDMLLSGIVENQIQMKNTLENHSQMADVDEERRRLYQLIHSHVTELNKTAERCRVLWESSIKEINAIYHFE